MNNHSGTAHLIICTFSIADAFSGITVRAAKFSGIRCTKPVGYAFGIKLYRTNPEAAFVRKNASCI